MKKLFNFSWKVLFVLFVSFAAVSCSNGGSSSEDSQLSRLLNSDDGASMDKETKNFYKKVKKLEDELLKAKTCEDVNEITAKFNKLTDAQFDDAVGLLGLAEKHGMYTIAMTFAFELGSKAVDLGCDTDSDNEFNNLEY